jgi:hypothetical protein
MLEKLVLANDPGRRVTVSPDDPLYLAAKVWLGQSRRPIGRISGYDFSVRNGRTGQIVDVRVRATVENPVAAAAEMDLRFLDLPGDFELAPVGGASDSASRQRVQPVQPLSSSDVELPLAGHLDSMQPSSASPRLVVTERHGGAQIRIPANLPIYRMRKVEGGMKMDGIADDWPDDRLVRLYGQMQVGFQYLSRPDLAAGNLRNDSAPATVRWSYDDAYLYLLARCPQGVVSDDRNSDWPVEQIGGNLRWWGTDGLQVQVAPLGNSETARVVQVAFKPAGVVLVKTAKRSGTKLIWSEGVPSGADGTVKYGMRLEKSEGRIEAYIVEAAIPRDWVNGKISGMDTPAWRVNILRHRASDLASMSWSGPVVDDSDVAMMGVMVGE